MWPFSLPNQKKKKVILITGASSGIGYATARYLLGRGHVVYGAARRVDRMTTTLPEAVHVVALDVTDEAQCRACVDRILREQGRLDVLINNAGYILAGSTEDVSIAQVQQQFDVNVFGMIRMAQLVLPHMRERNEGSILNVSSVVGTCPCPMSSAYVASKHAVEGWSDALRLDVAPLGVRVVLIIPGFVRTELMDGGRATLQANTSPAGPHAAYVGASLQASKILDYCSSRPETIAKMIARACEAKHPYRRYRAGFLAWPLYWIRTVLGDGLLDFVFTVLFLRKSGSSNMAKEPTATNKPNKDD